MFNLIAQNSTSIPLGPKGGFRGFGSLGLENMDASSALGVFTNFLSTTIGLMTIIAIIWFVFTFITGAIGIITSGGDKTALESARKKITTGIIGLVVVIAALFLIDLLGNLIGIKTILDVGYWFGQIQK